MRVTWHSLFTLHTPLNVYIRLCKLLQPILCSKTYRVFPNIVFYYLGTPPTLNATKNMPRNFIVEAEGTIAYSCYFLRINTTPRTVISQTFGHKTRRRTNNKLCDATMIQTNATVSLFNPDVKKRQSNKKSLSSISPT